MFTCLTEINPQLFIAEISSKSSTQKAQHLKKTINFAGKKRPPREAFEESNLLYLHPNKINESSAALNFTSAHNKNEWFIVSRQISKIFCGFQVKWKFVSIRPQIVMSDTEQTTIWEFCSFCRLSGFNGDIQDFQRAFKIFKAVFIPVVVYVLL